MSVPEQNMRTVMGWLSDDVTGASPGAEQVTEDLATLVFQGDSEWPNYQDRAAGYAQDISAWLTSDTEGQFLALTAEGGDPAAFLSWMLPVLRQWKASAAHDEAGQQGQGLANPNYASDPTPGTEYYRYDAATGEYLYSATADGTDGWAAYEQRRYSEPTWDDSYGLSYRYDKRDEAYEWYDEPNGTWNDQAWADQYAADRSGAEAQAAAAGAGAVGTQAASAAAWDENWQMFYRIGPSGAYEYADAVVPGDESSGSTEQWLSYEQVMMRATQEQSAPGEPEAAVSEPQTAPGDPVVAEIMNLVDEAIREVPEAAAVLSPEEINAVVLRVLEQSGS